ncbi:MAG: metallophosphoesterase, partial [Acetobacteraceae bacterium]|nr:metallophosphoesterase [Acetobacteraceae bacterium]
MRLIHTSDWQIGKAFGFTDHAVREVLRDERLQAIGRLGRLAQEHGASAVLVAGDVYDLASPSDRTLQQPIERMRQFPAIEWHLLPGNHDPHTPNGLWDRLRRGSLPDNVRLHLTGDPAPLGGGAWVIPAPLTQRHAAGDPTACMDGAGTPEAAIRLGLAHGSVRSFGRDDTTTHNLIAPDRADRAGLAYLALGDWHGAQEFGPRTWYSGTP